MKNIVSLFILTVIIAQVSAVEVGQYVRTGDLIGNCVKRNFAMHDHNPQYKFFTILNYPLIKGPVIILASFPQENREELYFKIKYVFSINNITDVIIHGFIGHYEAMRLSDDYCN